MNMNLLHNYARLVVRVGVNLQREQILVINAPIECAEFARAIAKDPKIYLFDDSFSALDFKTDVALRRALKAQTDNATVIIVAQRISTVLHANQILVLDEGRLVGKGTHAQLMVSCPEYQEIARSQLSQKELDLESLNTEKEGE